MFVYNVSLHLAQQLSWNLLTPWPVEKNVSGDPGHQHLYIRVGVIPLVLLVRVELHSLGLNS